MGDYEHLLPNERPGFIPPPGHASYPRRRHDEDDEDDEDDSDDDEDLAYGMPTSPRDDHERHQPSINDQSQYQYGQPGSAQNGHAPQYQYSRPDPQSSYSSTQYTQPQQYQYAQPPDKIKYTSTPQTSQQPLDYSRTPQGQLREQLPRTYPHNAYAQDAHVVDITPGADRRERKSSRSKTSKTQRLSVSTSQPSGFHAAPSPGGLGPRMDRLSVSGNRPEMHESGGGGLPPPSPLLEAYHGTYQSISPMPLAMRLDDDDVDGLQPLSPTVARGSNTERERDRDRRRVKVYDGAEDAKELAEAMNQRNVDTEVICEMLPKLSHDQILDLRKEYKNFAKIQGKGINLSKHLKLKVEGNFGKAAYVTALGRWESEGYWANFWYQSHGRRRELLIESLMGRSNAEIREIKDSFKDKRYSDSLIKCMEKELKIDKFRTAVLMVLEERRQEEQEVYPVEYRIQDVETLNRTLRAPQGGESAMLEVIVRRSDAHLREVLRAYERMYQENFARAALKKSNNLVGEVIAHILNGVINKPARDALLLRHAIKDIAEHNRDDDLRYELLISRLIRLHWDKRHLMRTKREYAEKYKKQLEEDIDDATKGDFQDFMYNLCQTK